MSLSTHRAKRDLLEYGHPKLSLTRQTQLLGISRASLYYQPVVNAEDLLTMNVLDEIYTKYPFYGSRRMQYELSYSYGIQICREHVQRLMRLMGLEAVFPKKSLDLSKAEADHKKYPYLLKDLTATFPNHIWGTDITYIRLSQGFCYLVALLDWYSRYVVAWTLSPTLAIKFCLKNLYEALKQGQPIIHNSDQGSHFTSDQYTNILTTRGIQISMDGRGRCMDNIFTERLWRTIKYENVYLQSYTTFTEAQDGLTEYLRFYNTQRPHQSLNNKTPVQVYMQNNQPIKQTGLYLKDR